MSSAVAVIDNYDSFTYNLVQCLAELGAEVHVYRNDAVGIDELAGHRALVISPGPGTPGEAGISTRAVKELSGRMPILGVCLGHQCLAEAFGGLVVRGGEPVHGKTSAIEHDSSGPLAGLPNPFQATRYHSLVVEPGSVPADLRVMAWSSGGIIMGLAHRTHPTFGLQFHPESVLTAEGPRLLANFLELGS